MRYGDSPSLAATLVEEGKNSPADLFFAQDAGSLDAIEKAGNLAAAAAGHPRQGARALPLADRPLGRRRPARSRIIAYGEKVKASELPDSPLELTDAKWKGRVGWAPTNASLQGYVTALRLVEGEDVARKWLEGMVANDVQVYDSNVPIRDAIAKGEIDLGLINHYYVAEAQAEGSRTTRSRSTSRRRTSARSSTSPASASSPRASARSEAIAFVRSMLAKPAQEYFADSSKEYPLARGRARRPRSSRRSRRSRRPTSTSPTSATSRARSTLMRETGAL